MNPYRGLGVVMAVTVGGDLEGQALVAHGIVIADDAVVLDAKDVRQVAGEYAAIGSMPSWASARPTWVGLSLSTLPPASGVCQ